ncbi:interleukin-6 receptor subunit alpha [Nematolebias whitei]|uniref:interleukin-6 receptor subunit alpha n=1 Tax=Nematolebias whitei TaxID=451745 RepID=UPI00189B5676|nr:interleukin-6 receptor subunit alpha [Nematolebias whitei]
MVIFLPFLILVLRILPICSIFEGTCPRKDPPPGVLVVSSGSRLVLTCDGDVKVNEAKVILTSSICNKKRPAPVRTPAQRVPSRRPASTLQNTEAGVSSDLRHSDTGRHAVSPDTVHPTSVSRTTTGGSDWEEENDDGDREDEEEGSRVTRGIRARHQWKWNKLPEKKRDRNWGQNPVISHEDFLSLASVRPTDAGKYACYRQGEESFAVKVFVADPPESPSLSCYKKSPSSKIRCEWKPQKPVLKHPDCYLILKKGETTEQVPCSYSSQHSQCWCALEHNEDEQRTLHVASLCVTSILGNATSPPSFFKPLNILKPDPPSNISAHQEEGHERRLKVSWNLPRSWKRQDDFYDLIYELRYRPLTSAHEQVDKIKSQRSYIITNTLPGEEYLIQLRLKEEYDGQWSEWSSPLYARSWTAEVVETDYSTTTMVDLSTLEDLGSGLPDDDCLEGSVGERDCHSFENDSCLNSDAPGKIPHYVLWISVSFAFLSAIFAIYIFRHKDKFVSKLHKLHVITWCGDLSPPSPLAPAATKEETVTTFLPQLYEECPPSDMQEEDENEEEQTVTGRIEAMNFNNTSYFFLQSEL